VRYVARVGERRGAFKFLEGKPEAKKPLGRPGIDGWIILKCIFRKLEGA